MSKPKAKVCIYAPVRHRLTGSGLSHPSPGARNYSESVCVCAGGQIPINFLVDMGATSLVLKQAGGPVNKKLTVVQEATGSQICSWTPKELWAWERGL